MYFNFLTHRAKPTELTAQNGPGKPGIFFGLYGRDYIRKRQTVEPKKLVQTSALLKKQV